MTGRHIHFEFLCALAPSGQLSPQEQAELRDHARHCAKCAQRLAELIDLGGEIFLTEALKEYPSRFPSGARERFQARALREGIPLHPDPSSLPLAHVFGLAATVLIAALTIAATLPGVSILRRSFPIESSKQIHPSKMPFAVAKLESSLSEQAGPATARIHARHARLSRRNIQAAIASRETGAVPLLRPFALGRYARLNAAWHYPPFSSTPQPVQSDALLALTYPRVASARSHEQGEFRGADGYTVAQLWTNSEFGASRYVNQGAFTRTTFRLNARAFEPPALEPHSSLDLDAYLPSAKLDLRPNIPRFHLLQDSAE
jgi:hypothetical protein